MIYKTIDYDFITEVSTHPKVWPFISDDYCNIEDFKPNSSMLYLLVEDNGSRMGYFGLTAINSICFEIHTTMLPIAWGKTLQYTSEVLDWIFSNTKCLKVITFVPETNQKALNLALKTGLSIEGFLPNSFLKNGALIGQYILGIGRGESCH